MNNNGIKHTQIDKLSGNWNESPSDVFWGEIAPCNHLLQIYESDEIILDSLQSFVTSGLNSGESVIIIATDEHLKGLNARLAQLGYNLDELRESNQYLPFNAHDTLAKFMVNDWPDEKLFMDMVTSVVSSARGKANRRVRAYGEMVAILWAKGNNGATVQLEHLWNKFCENEVFCLFCAYPKSGFTEDVHASINHICSTHSQVIAGDRSSTSQVFYKSA